MLLFVNLQSCRKIACDSFTSVRVCVSRLCKNRKGVRLTQHLLADLAIIVVHSIYIRNHVQAYAAPLSSVHTYVKRGIAPVR